MLTCMHHSGNDESAPHYYAGKLSKTASGKTCQRWDSDYPHKRDDTIKETQFPDETLADASNYCRDPFRESILWCRTTDPETNIENCLFFETASDRCFSTLSSYEGKHNETYTGKSCQYWNDTTPHDHDKFSDSQFPDRNVEEAQNFCRDPHSEGYLWCFTTDPGTRHEPCLFDYKYQLKDTGNAINLHGTPFVCDNGILIPYEHECNGKVDCADVSDENNCTREQKLLTTMIIPKEDPLMSSEILFHCESLEWVLIIARCDGVIDCMDASDEKNCAINNCRQYPVTYV
ncbi:plasminogen-like [Ruditapes philippinarum]|uniref:plasminogen-like n=1 Tax=Ruditapes philippinarum TaxID=129788 RepID=UPI00295BDDCA|nr:plasminogen-like [Ruditapes philippinarum]